MLMVVPGSTACSWICSTSPDAALAARSLTSSAALVRMRA